jgi:hypothetical protein
MSPHVAAFSIGVKFFAPVEIAAAPRAVWASAFHAKDPTNRIAAVVVSAIAILRIASLRGLKAFAWAAAHRGHHSTWTTHIFKTGHSGSNSAGT